MVRLEGYDKPTCLFLHRLDIGSYLQEWCETGRFQIFYNYRDPRDALISLICYLSGEANQEYTKLPWNMVYASILATMPSFDDRLSFAISHMGLHTNKYRDFVWLYYHPKVCKIAYEDLVGPRGGGSTATQKDVLDRVARHLGVTSTDCSESSELYDPAGRTFRQGAIGQWMNVFKANHVREFSQRYGDILRTYGYE